MVALTQVLARAPDPSTTLFTALAYCLDVIDGSIMNMREVVQIDAGRKSFHLCRQSDTEWTLYHDRWATGVRQLSAIITLVNANGALVWRVATMPGRRNPREVTTWTTAIDTATSIA